MESVVATALHETLSVLSEESHAAMVFMLEDKYGVRLNLPDVNFEGIRRGLTDLLGPAADILLIRLEQSIMQHAQGPTCVVRE